MRFPTSDPSSHSGASLQSSLDDSSVAESARRRSNSHSSGEPNIEYGIGGAGHGSTMLPEQGSEEAKLLEIEACCQLIERCDFVALDLEFSGLFSNFKKCNQVQKHYKMCVENVSNFTALQLGICVVSRDPKDRNKWLLSPFNFYIFPSQRRVFLCDSSTIKWLSLQGFDFKKWIALGYDYTRLANLAHNGGALDLAPTIAFSGLQRIIGTVSQCSKPIVTHNGFLDMLHLFDKFIEPLPNTIEQFATDWMNIFPGNFFDTKRMAQVGELSILSRQEAKGMNLEALRSALLSQPVSTSIFSVSSQRLLEHPEYVLCNQPYNLHEKSHEAGFDALLTAQTFILEIEALWRIKHQSSVGVNDSKTVIPEDWLNLEVIQQVANVLEMPSMPGGELRLSHHTRNRAGSESHNRFTKIKNSPIRNQPEVYQKRPELHPKLRELFDRHKDIKHQQTGSSEPKAIPNENSKPVHESQPIKTIEVKEIKKKPGPPIQDIVKTDAPKPTKNDSSKSSPVDQSPRSGPKPSTQKRRRRRKAAQAIVANALNEAETALIGRSGTNACSVFIRKRWEGGTASV
eukprot:GHVP01000370.1.p1 GENE.GHVP01000370.1~~GHVP01000370.1.p1  ORF type:complete len:591 (-),score=93.44 GHVP01000370.1:161-1873(-)